jgi:alpha-tubulin suppressor-like RCC1 family protein
MQYSRQQFASIGCGHGAVVTQDGEVVCWGNDWDHQLDMPSDLENVTVVSCGEFHTAVVTHEGSVVWWGFNE